MKNKNKLTVINEIKDWDAIRSFRFTKVDDVVLILATHTLIHIIVVNTITQKTIRNLKGISQNIEQSHIIKSEKSKEKKKPCVFFVFSLPQHNPQTPVCSSLLLLLPNGVSTDRLKPSCRFDHWESD
ncbi:hypothetical protein L2E82_02407 [Cichorium intybus]|uniref:Uncharacterized protein n=1 Tax=Cichorium intybus TaxID=13427 RepID=A0ACB9H1J8_CICIN|nr:hypothetical protein L1887_03842 [Cichorium endivia]KAI3789607.1 hypothetical protein L2E82_02407 [Cichorium intybus]